MFISDSILTRLHKKGTQIVDAKIPFFFNTVSFNIDTFSPLKYEGMYTVVVKLFVKRYRPICGTLNGICVGLQVYERQCYELVT